MTIRGGITGPGGGNLPDASVTESKIVAGAIVPDHLAPGVVGAAALGAGSVTAAALGAGSVTDAALGSDSEHTLRFVYDGAVLGYTQGVYTLTDAAGAALTIPAYSTISRVAIRVVTAVTSGGSATVSVGYTASAAGFLSATGKASLGAAVGIDTAPTIVAPIIIGSSAVSVTATVAAADLTAGKLVVWVSYFPGSATV